MKTYARWLFGLAALFNALVGLTLLLGLPQLGHALGLDSVNGTNLVFTSLTAGFIMLFAYAYLRLALDPARFRVFIGFGVVGKLMAVLTAAALFLLHVIDARLPTLAGGDLIFAALFADYLRRTR